MPYDLGGGEDVGSDSSEDTEEDESTYSNNSDDESYESEEDDGSSRTLLFLCEEGQLDKALKRVKLWEEQCPIALVEPISNTLSTFQISADREATSTESCKEKQEEIIQRELFRKSPYSGNFCLHEILAGGTSGTSAPELVERLVRRYQNNDRSQTVFLAQPRGSNGRTILHWCAWCKTTPEILRIVLEVCPEALCLRDHKTHGSRTPLEIAKRYWPEDPITKILQQSTCSYLRHRLRSCLRLCVRRYFESSSKTNENVTNKESGNVNTRGKTKARARGNEFSGLSQSTTKCLMPFDRADRRVAGLTPRSWFVSSVLGYALQREMKDLETRILSFVGHGARIDSRKTRKRKNQNCLPGKKVKGNP